MPTSGGISPRNTRPWLILLPIFASFVVFAPSLRDAFVFDDSLLIQNNSYVHSFSHLGRAFLTTFWDTSSNPFDSENTFAYYRPLVTVSYLFNWVLAPGTPWLFHLVNLLLHTTAVTLSFKALNRWLSRPYLAVLGALLFAVHPTRAESVIWISGRTDLLAFVFLFGGTELLNTSQNLKNSTHRTITTAFAWLCVAAAFLSKEASVLLPLVILIEWASSSVSGINPSTKRFWRNNLIAAVGVSSSYLLARQLLMPLRGFKFQNIGDSLFWKVEYVCVTLGRFVERVLYPWPQTMFYKPLLREGVDVPLATAEALLGVAAVAVWGALVLWSVRKNRVVLALSIAFGASILPYSNLQFTGLQVTTADRFLYMPLLFLAGILGLICPKISIVTHKWFYSLVLVLPVTAIFVIYGAIDIQRCFDFANDKSFWSHELEVNPANPMALRQLGRLLLVDGSLEAGFASIRSSLQKQSTRHVLLSSEHRQLEAYVELLEVQGNRIADGDLPSLRLLRDELIAMAQSKPRPDRAKARDFSVGRSFSDSALLGISRQMRSVMLLDAAVLAVRVGDDTKARQLLLENESAISTVPINRIFNLALAYARLGEWGKAEGILDELSAGAVVNPLLRTKVQETRERLRSGERTYRQADSLTGPSALVVRAQAQAELGAYGRALRLLHPVYLQTPEFPGLGPLFVQVLLAARLKELAMTEASKALGPEAALRVVDGIERQLPPALQSIPSIPGDEFWK